jgi:hypothetical protein
MGFLAVARPKAAAACFTAKAYLKELEALWRTSRKINKNEQE